MELIAFVGRKFSGKSTAAKHTRNTHEKSSALESLATPIKAHVKKIFGPLEETPKEILRPVMQTLGEALKQKFGKTIFVDELHYRTTITEDPVDLVVIDDVRFDFEADYVRNQGGYVIRIIRPSTDDSGDTHVSETSMDNIQADATIINDAGLEVFLQRVTNTLGRLRDYGDRTNQQ